MAHQLVAFLQAVVTAMALALSAASISHAQGNPVATVLAANVESTEEGYQLNADFDLNLSPAMVEAIRKGVALHFVVDFEVSKNRWYWLDQAVIRVVSSRRVTYAPLTDQYRLTSAGISRNVASMAEVHRFLSRVRSWTVAERGRLTVGEKYDAQVRIRLDTSQLPKPFQVSALGNKDWSLASDWVKFSFVAEKP